MIAGHDTTQDFQKGFYVAALTFRHYRRYAVPYRIRNLLQFNANIVLKRIQFPAITGNHIIQSLHKLFTYHFLMSRGIWSGFLQGPRCPLLHVTPSAQAFLFYQVGEKAILSRCVYTPPSPLPHDSFTAALVGIFL